MTLRLPRMAATLAALAACTTTSCGGSSVAAVDVSLRLSAGCTTPDLAVGSEIWATEAAVPTTWTGLSSIPGTLIVNGDKALFTATDGTRLAYTAVPERSTPGCGLA